MSSGLDPSPRTLMASGGDRAVWNEGETRARIERVESAGHKSFGAVTVENELRALAMSRDAKWVGTIDGGPKGKGLQVWKVADLKESTAWKCPSTEALALSADGTLAAGCSGEDGKVWVFDTETGKEVRTLDVPDQVRFLQFLPTGNGLVLAGKAGIIHVYDARTGKPLTPLGGHTGVLRGVAALPDGGTLTASADGTAKLWDIAGKEVRTFTGHAGAIHALALAPDAKTLFTAGADATVRAWDVAKGTELRRFAADKSATTLQCLSLSTDGKTLAVGGDRSETRMLDATTLKPFKAFDESGAIALAFAGERLVARDRASRVGVWDTIKGAELRDFSAHRASTKAVPLAASPDGKTIASVIGEEKGQPVPPAVDVGLWDVETGKLLDRVQVGRRESEVTAVAYLPGGKAIAVGDAGGTVWVIDLDTKKPVHTFKGHRGPVLCLSASPDGKTLSSGGADTTVLVWKLDNPN